MHAIFDLATDSSHDDIVFYRTTVAFIKVLVLHHGVYIHVYMIMSGGNFILYLRRGLRLDVESTNGGSDIALYLLYLFPHLDRLLADAVQL